MIVSQLFCVASLSLFLFSACASVPPRTDDVGSDDAEVFGDLAVSVGESPWLVEGQTIQSEYIEKSKQNLVHQPISRNPSSR